VTRWLVRLALLAAAPASAAPTLDQFTRPDEVTAVAIAPTGAALAAGLQVGDTSRVAFMRLPDLKKEATIDDGEDVRVDQIEWLTRGRFAYTLRARAPQRLERLPKGEVFALGVLKNDQTEFEGFDFTDGRGYASADIVRRLSDERVLVLEHPWRRAQDGWRDDADTPPTLAVIDVKSSRRTLLERLPVRDASVLTDDQGRARIVTGAGANGARVTYWKPDSAWMPLETPRLRPESVVPRLYSADDRTLTLTGARAGNSLIGLYRQQLDSREIEALYEDPKTNVQDVVFNLSGTRVVGVVVEDARPEYRWIDAGDPAAKLYQLLERTFAGSTLTVTSTTADHRFVTVLVRSDVDPGAYYRVDTTTRNAEFLFAVRPWIDPAQMRAMESQTITARDGTTLHAYVTRPAGAKGPYPLVVMPHDDPFAARDRWAFDWRVQLLASYGYAVLQVNYRGTPGYGVDFAAAGNGEWGGAMQDDVTDATLWAIEHGIAEQGNVCIYGEGYGGYAALMGGIREPQLYRCVASYGAITDLELLIDETEAAGPATAAAMAHGLPARDALQARSPDYNAARIEAPVLLIHDQLDPVVSFTHATRMNQALRSASRRVVLEATRSGEHGLERRDHREQVYARLLDFLARNLTH